MLTPVHVYWLWFCLLTNFTLLRTALFWVITQRVMVISYRHFGTFFRILDSWRLDW